MDYEIAYQVWRVSGDPEKTLLASKEDAEKHARYLFPKDDAHKRYMRVNLEDVWKIKGAR